MKLILLSDVHLTSKNPTSRIDNLTETQWTKFEFILSYAQKYRCPVLMAGDIFHQARSYSVLERVTKLLSKYKNVKIFSISGNHDSLMRSDLCNNLSLLYDNSAIGHLTKEPTQLGDIFLYGADYDGAVPEVINKDVFNVLVVHDNIAKENLNIGTEKIIKAKDYLKEYADFNLVLTGHIHKKFIVKNGNRVICNTGCMNRMSASKYNLSDEALPRFFVYDTKNNEIETILIPCKTGSEVLSRESIEKDREMDIMLDDFSKALTDETSTDINFVDNIDKYIKEHKVSAAVKALITAVMISDE